MRPALHAAAALALAALAAATRAGPPFLTDDPVPVDLNHWEAYFFGSGDRTSDGTMASVPAAEFNYGILPETQFHFVATEAVVRPAGVRPSSGWGDSEVGVKYRFINSKTAPVDVGVFPMAELATARSGLGNGRTWFRLPVWVQKSWGPWTTYGGAGEALNSAPGERNHAFGGWQVQRDFGPHLTLGVELFGQGADAQGGRGTAIANGGGQINFTEGFSLLFTAGRSVAGERHTVWYLGLYWTGGPEKK